ncbi:MAG: glycoside hydrolase family 88 protein [Lachnospiraceae bacterium]|jgi:unsaturated chondroitin disaccharide hydrolase|nr:glycoside hydrolase family 88 protein [Lachnospiraceae bacterium]
MTQSENRVLKERYPEITQNEIKAALDFACAQNQKNLKPFTKQIPMPYGEVVETGRGQGHFYRPMANTDWTAGFWPGEVWLSYEYSREGAFRRAGEVLMDSFLQRIEQKIEVDHHDMGFLYTPSCVAGYRLTGSEAGRRAALKAADQLVSRFQEKGGFIQAWGPMDAPDNYRLIIDCLMNLPLLYWAAGETGEYKYEDIALRHTKATLDNVVRDDFSTWHTFFFDRGTGKPHHGETCQGYRNGSAWARGQAWGIYGTALAYRYTGDAHYIDLFRGITGYFLDHLPLDLVPYWDLEFTDGSGEPKDSSSASIAACGLLDMACWLGMGEGEGEAQTQEETYYGAKAASFTPGDGRPWVPDRLHWESAVWEEDSDKVEAAMYTRFAKQIMKSVYDNYAVKDSALSNGLVLHSTYSNHSPYNTCNHCGVDTCNLFGDYFYMEALRRLWGPWESWW